jgi:chromosome segregation ATPase
MEGTERDAVGNQENESLRKEIGELGAQLGEWKATLEATQQHIATLSSENAELASNVKKKEIAEAELIQKLQQTEKELFVKCE